MEEESFLDLIKPPRLEDAGLEDCALPPESIKEAFLKAASAVRSIISSSGDKDEGGVRCVEDPWEDSSDALVGITEGTTGPTEGCIVEKGGGLTEAPGDRVSVGGGDEKSDAVVVPGAEEGGGEAACVDGLQGLEIGEKGKGNLGKKIGETDCDVDEDEEKRADNTPILVEGFGA
ncbi:RNA-binding (RRM/RBD/RNP motifs) family protein [Striga asiatica]|uniref:RNA-binding (RRM/RBD/RNP motifs) family protein n=1 Tax=Striga asiatica TaxID=4170 RepID=A0A5A7QJ93_STRAF|nr:RNA-binding (RRM/RBD/RNP motifs) family protein [Striga asiatica]